MRRSIPSTHRNLAAAAKTPEAGAGQATVDSVDMSALAAAAKTPVTAPGQATVDSVDASAFAAAGNAPLRTPAPPRWTRSTRRRCPKPKQPTYGGFDRTIELPAAPEGEITKPEGDRPTRSRTVDSVGDVAAAGGAAQNRSDVLTTLDSAEVKGHVTRRLGEIWGDDVDQSKPSMTLKGKTATAEPRWLDAGHPVAGFGDTRKRLASHAGQPRGLRHDRSAGRRWHGGCVPGPPSVHRPHGGDQDAETEGGG